MKEAERLYMESSKSFEQLSVHSKTSQNLTDVFNSQNNSDMSTPTPKSASPLPTDSDEEESKSEEYTQDFYDENPQGSLDIDDKDKVNIDQENIDTEVLNRKFDEGAGKQFDDKKISKQFDEKTDKVLGDETQFDKAENNKQMKRELKERNEANGGSDKIDLYSTQSSLRQFRKEQLTKEQLIKDQLSIEQLTKQQVIKEQLSIDQLTKEQLEKEQISTEQLVQEQLAKEQFIADRISKKLVAKELFNNERTKEELGIEELSSKNQLLNQLKEQIDMYKEDSEKKNGVIQLLIEDTKKLKDNIQYLEVYHL